MKRVGGMYEPILELDNFLVAFHRAARGKRYRAEVREFQDGLPKAAECGVGSFGLLC